VQKSDWQCIQCGRRLGGVFGGEFYPDVPPDKLRTSGPNLVVTCPDCGAIKTWYTADPLVRAVYQLVDAIASVAARSMVEQVGRSVNNEIRKSG
jgi:ribosomal protein S27E